MLGRPIERGDVMATTRSDLLGFGLFLTFGLWWLLLPGSVIRFYAWFHGRSVALPSPGGVRLLGAIWCAVVLAITYFAR
jgi:hypothetical protein